MRVRRANIFFILAAGILVTYACSEPSFQPTTNPSSLKNSQIPWLDPSDTALREKLGAEAHQRREQALQRSRKRDSANSIIKQRSQIEEAPFSIQRYWGNRSVTYSSPLVYYNNVLLAEPFTVNSNDKITLPDGSQGWYTTAFNWTKVLGKDNFQIGYVDYMDYLHTYTPPKDFVFARDDDSYWESWSETNYLDKRFKISSSSEMYISSSVDAKGPPDVIGELRYKIYSVFPRELKYEGAITNLQTPVDLVDKHDMVAGSYYLELYITKPASSADNKLGVKKSLFHTVIDPLPRADYYIDIDLKSPRWITPAKADDNCANGVSIKVNRKPGIEAEQPLFAESVVWVYKYPSFDLVGEFPALAGTGNYNFVWDGKDPDGNPLPDGLYNIEVALKNYRKAPSGNDRGDWEIIHISNNTPVDPKHCPSGESGNEGGDESDGICSDTLSTAPGNNSKSCFRCPEANQQVVFKDGIPVSCTPATETENEKHMFSVQSNGSQPYGLKYGDHCLK